MSGVPDINGQSPTILLRSLLSLAMICGMSQTDSARAGFRRSGLQGTSENAGVSLVCFENHDKGM